MKLSQNDFEHIKELNERGEITLDQAHVMMVRVRRVLLVKCKIPAAVRRALNAAVQTGELARMKREGHKPEAYFHPAFDYLARSERNEHERSVLKAALVPLVKMSNLQNSSTSP